METVQKFTYFTCIILSLIIEEIIRILFFPIGVLFTIFLTISGFGKLVKNNKFLTFCSPWKTKDHQYFPISSCIAKWITPY